MCLETLKELMIGVQDWDQIKQHIDSYMQKTCDVAEKAILAKKNLRKKCVNRDKM